MVCAARTAVCCANLRQMQSAYQLYLDDHDGRFFPWRETVDEGLANAPKAFMGLLRGENFGKQLVRIGPDKI